MFSGQPVRTAFLKCCAYSGGMQVEGQTPGFKGASRAYRKIGECAAACRFVLASPRQQHGIDPSTGTHLRARVAGEAECGLECDDVFMGTMQKQVKRHRLSVARPPLTLQQLFRSVCHRV
jgi:hypothetical protein